MFASVRSVVCNGEQALSSLPGARLRGKLSVSQQGMSIPQLTRRECQVLVGVAQGYSSKQIAVNLRRSVKTIVKHRSNMMRKLSLHDASAVTRYAISNGLLYV